MLIKCLILSMAVALGAQSYDKRICCHDPSIVVDTITSKSSPKFYIYGSHLGRGYTTAESNYLDWSTFKSGEENKGSSNSLFCDTAGVLVNYSKAYSTHIVRKVKNYKGEVVDLGNFDAHGWQYEGNNVDGMQWAPDVIYNKTMKKWCMYMSLNGDYWCSSIVCFTSDNIQGPWMYQGPVVISGFRNLYPHNSYTTADDWKYTDLAIATGYTSLPERYIATDKTYGDFWPNAIDPCVFYDDEDNLWMSYGSWSGGIFMLKLDPSNGLRDYSYTYDYEVNGSKADANANANANCTSDPYFGKKIAGGCYVSGEASYIEKIGEYYFLFMSYGGLTSTGGYQMRVFRSESPTGPFVDTQGTSALFTSYKMNYGPYATDNRGVLLFGGYKWDNMSEAEISQGHNSAFTDPQGRSFVVYHTRGTNSGEGHSVRVHQLFLNAEGWLMAAPYEFHGETITNEQIASAASIADKDIPGNYQLIRHQYNQDYENKTYETPVNVELTADGMIQGDATGTWTRTANTDYITLTMKIGGSQSTTYKGVLTKQTVDYTDVITLCISALSSSSGGTTVGRETFTRQQEVWLSKTDDVKEPTPVYYPESTEKNTTSGWWQNFSKEDYTLAQDKSIRFVFVNHSDRSANYKNWCLYGASATHGAADYTEYFGIRCDNWNNTSWSNEGLISDFNWDTFINDMDGSLVDMTVNYTSAGIFTMNASITTTDSKKYSYFYSATIASKPSTINIFFVNEGSYIDYNGATDINSIGVGISFGNDKVYNLQGLKVDNNYKGIVICNGRKFIRK